jgi:hypothetical protein
MTQDETEKHPQVIARRNWAEAVGRGADSAAMSAFQRAGFRDPTLVTRWTEIVGPEVARFARPLRLSESASGGVLTVKAEPGAAMFLQHQARELCERINRYLGRAAIVRLKFVQGEIAARQDLPRLGPKRGEMPPADPVRGFHGPEKLKDALVNLARVRARPRNPTDD